MHYKRERGYTSDSASSSTYCHISFQHSVAVLLLLFHKFCWQEYIDMCVPEDVAAAVAYQALQKIILLSYVLVY
jgi:hypothetical protein